MIAQVIQAGKATLRELRECYSMHDLYCIWEIVHNDLCDRVAAHEEYVKRLKARR